MSTPYTLRVLETSFDPEMALREFQDHVTEREKTTHISTGAIVSFTGRVRGQSGAQSSSTLALELTAYPGYTEQEISRIAETALARWPLSGLCIIHRIGHLTPDQPIVFVATAAAHRRAAFEAADFVMDYLKTEAPFWKKEHRSDGTHWIEPRDQDRADKTRWQNTPPPQTHPT